MLRMLVLAAFVLATSVPLAGSAHTIPAGVNPHNGYIQVNNRVVVHAPPYPESKKVNSAPSRGLELRYPLGRTEFKTVLGLGPLYFNACCILAGSRYLITMTSPGKTTEQEVTPRLCNVRGIPFGFAEITFAGDVIWDSGSMRWISHVTVHVDNAACPTD